MPDAALVLGGWPLPRVWTLDDLRRIRREIDAGVIGPDRGRALARLDELITQHGG